MKVKEFFKNFGMGALIGGAMIIPGVSGGTIAVLLNVYDKLIGAISDLRRDFKNSFFYLLPLALGAVVAVLALFIPLQFAIDRAPFPTVLLFVGLMVGGLPNLIKDGAKNGFKPIDILSLVLPLAVVLGICFIPSLGEVNLGGNMPVYGYFLLILIGALGSCALVIPGVSGSMLLLIFGYYEPILNTVKGLLSADFGHCILVLLCFGVGLLVGFFSIAKLMKLFLKKFPRGTHWAIIGFVLGSVPAIFITYNHNFPEHTYATLSPVHIAVGVILCVAGIIATFALTAVVEAKKKKQAESVPQTDSSLR